jgi:integrase
MNTSEPLAYSLSPDSVESFTKSISFCNGKLDFPSISYEGGCQGKRKNERMNDQTVGRVIWLYLKHSAVSKRTARNNSLCLLKILEVTHGSPRPAEKIPIEEVNAAAISTYQSTLVERYTTAAPKDHPAQREARERALRTSRSTIIQARSLFSKRGDIDLWSIYRSHGPELPDCIEGFCSAKVRGKSTKIDYKSPSDEVVHRSMDAIELMRADDDVYCAFWLAIGAGLRKSEIRFCEWDFLKVVDGKPRVIGGCGKNGDFIDVPIQSRAYMSLVPFKAKWEQRKEAVERDGLTSPGPFVIQERGGDRWARRLSTWMRGQGWQTRKTLHELRAYLGSQLYSKASPVTAMRVLRHKSIQVTERSYVRYGMGSESLDVL